ncbi:MAG: hypothetical protein MPJ50_03585 [Pirellulales bacterium]|nr:hypothetical protein [Pirellulales bacterium]
MSDEAARFVRIKANMLKSDCGRSNKVTTNQAAANFATLNGIQPPLS